MVGALLALALCAAPAKTLDSDSAIDKAHARMKSLDYEAALPLLQKALASPKLTGRARAGALIDLAVTQINLGDATGARLSFDAAIAEDASVPLPKSASPKIVEMYNEALERSRPPPPPVEAKPEPPVEPAPKQTDTTPPTSSQPPVEAAATPAKVEVASAAAPATSPLRAPGWALLGGGLALAAGGGVTLFLAKSEDSKLTAGGFATGKDIQAAFERRSTYNLTAVSLAAVGGLAAVVGVILVALPGPSPHAVTSVGVVPSAQGATVFASGRF